jgi:undecaprenyl-diphosphatase
MEHSWLRQIGLNARATFLTLCRAARPPSAAWPDTAKILLVAAVAIAVIVSTMFALDAWSVRQARGLPVSLLTAARGFTDLGKSGYFLWPLGILMLLLIALYSPAMQRFWRGILAAWAVRIGFVFIAIGLPSLFDNIIKNMIGRARPFVVAGPDVWAYEPFTWHARYASFPSGHASTAFAALVAIGAIFPQARALMWIYAVLIALSRVVITAHHPSDVIGGAIVGAVGAVLVRNWFADRRLGFAVAVDGSVRAMPGPSLGRIIKAVARRLHSA